MNFFTPPYLLNPTHKLTVGLVGVGGTGSMVLSGIARINEALIALGHPGMDVIAFDPDKVSEANVGRQLFSIADIGTNKAVLAIERINRFFGYNWDAHPKKFKNHKCNIIITCVDTAAARIQIGRELAKKQERLLPYQENYLWMDFGNSKNFGQCILGASNPKHAMLPTVLEEFENKWDMEEDNSPSCSLAQALNKQDLFINSTLAQLGLAILWKLFRTGQTDIRGCYLNLETMKVNPIKIKA